MPASVGEQARKRLEAIYRADFGRILATLIRLLGDFDLAEDAVHDAFAAVLERWPQDGVPANPRAWLISTGRFQAIDTLRRRVRFDASQKRIAEQLETGASTDTVAADEIVADDQLRLIFTCCHPALAPEARLALTLREVCGLTTEEIARAFLSAVPTLAQHREVRTVTASLYRTMSLCQQGQLGIARQLFSETETKIKPLPKAGQWPLTHGVDHDDLILWLAYREARSLLQSSNQEL